MVAGLAGLHFSKRQPLSGVRKLRENCRYLLVGLVRHHAMVEVRTSQGGAEGLRSPSVSVAGPSGCAPESKGSGRIPRPQSQKGRSRAQPAQLSIPPPQPDAPFALAGSGVVPPRIRPDWTL